MTLAIVLVNNVMIIFMDEDPHYCFDDYLYNDYLYNGGEDEDDPF